MAYRYKKCQGMPRFGKRKDEHRSVMEDYLGRPLEDDEISHHCNNDGKDNRIENLELTLKSEHPLIHILNGDYPGFGRKRKNGPDGTSWCAGCQQFLPIEDFHKDKRSKNGLRSYCKSCKKEKGY